MVDPLVRRLVEQVISSPVKLQLLLLFADHQSYQATAAQLAHRMYRDIWSIREALADLVQDGVVVGMSGGTEPVYRYCPRADLVDSINRLCQMYNEPIERDNLQRLVRDVANFAVYRRQQPQMWFEYM